MKKRDNTEDIGSAIHKIMRSGKMKHKYYQTLIQHFFETEFGAYCEDISSIRLYGSKLVVRVDSASLRNELSLSKNLLLRRLNEELQEQFLEEVEIR